MTQSTSSAKPHVCPECGQAFSRTNGLRRHLTATHGHEPSSKTRPATPARNDPEPDLVADVRKDVEAIVAPLRERLASIDGVIAKRQREIVELRDARRVISNALRPFEAPKPRPSGKSLGAQISNANQDARKLDATRTFLVEHRDDFAPGFTREQLAREMRAAKVEPISSSPKLGELLDRLRDEGLVRADRVVKGGGMLYVLTSNGSGDGSA